MCGAGDHILVVDSCYEPTRTLCERTLKRFGIETSYYAPGDDIAPYLKPNTKAVFCESPGLAHLRGAGYPGHRARPRMRTAPPC